MVERRHFLGAVALINSLRLQGHDEPVVLLDCGLDARQREILSREATILEAHRATAPHLLKAVAPLRQPNEFMLLIDTDIIATRSLDPIFDVAAQGKVVAFADRLDRYDPRWQEMLHLDRPVRRQPYINSGLIVLPRDPGLRLLRRLEECEPYADVERSLFGSGTSDYPLYFLDQDILNALLGAEFAAEDVDVLPHRLAPHPRFNGVAVADRRRILCTYPDGEQPFVLHHIQRKPWLARVPASVYSVLLPRLLLEPDVALRLKPSDLPMRLRSGRAGGVARRGITLAFAVTSGRRRLGIRRHQSKAGGVLESDYVP